MMRALVLLLVLANAVWWGWSQGWLPAGLLPLPLEDGQREPRRLQAQLKPEAVVVVPAAEAQRLASVACLQAGPYDTAATAAAEAVLLAAALPVETWQKLPAGGGVLLRLPEADAAQQARLRATPGHEMFRPCP
ncbi:MAG: hypothetical protein Fur0014_09430 [Rubrivivax sp.]